ncbi:CRISPR-associated endonuclease Cas2 [Patescibacteria group bacterium]|nr:MAG: CRISPR-associated endonuclease Cas2 [Patescibacteria group bacterium]
MGEIERKSARKLKYKNIQNAVLAVVATGVFLSAAILAPNALQVFSKLGITGKRKREGVSRARDRLLEKGMLKKDEKGYLQITNKGRIKLGMRHELVRKPMRWDKRWRVLIFDIPEKRKEVRNKIRQMLISAGFLRLQDSVWVYPHNCEDFVALLKADLHIGKDLLYLLVDSIENDKYLKEEFDLKK